MVHRGFLSLFFAAFCLGGLSAGESITSKKVVAIKSATVYVKVDVRGVALSGSGFVVHTAKDEAWIVTNHHVIEPKVQIEVPSRSPTNPRLRPPVNPRLRPPVNPRLRPPVSPDRPQPLNPRQALVTLKDAAVTVVFDSGTKKEHSFKAEVVAFDSEHDLALLHVKDAKDLPEPIDCAKMPELTETMSVYTFGFPFGKVLAVGKKGPAITVGKATISSLRDNDDGELAYVQIDGSLNPGNSGGPMVDARGQLVGVAVATIKNSSGIGLAIPGAEVRKMLLGRLGTYNLSSSPPQDSKIAVTVEVGVVDPFHKIKTITLHYLPASGVADLTKQVELAKMPNVQKVELAIEKYLATGKFVVPAGAKGKGLLLQAVLGSDGGKSQLTKVMHQQFSTEPNVGKGNTPGVDLGGVDGATRILGGGFNPQFKDEAPVGGLLVGFEFGLIKLGNHDNIKAIRPIYRVAKEEVKGKQYGKKLERVVTVKAKDGYAIGALTVNAGLWIDGLSVTYMRVADGKLDVSDSYQSDYLGGPGGSRSILGGAGTPVIGLLGKTNNQNDFNGIGLLFKKR